MEIERLTTSNTVVFWLTQSERDDPAFRDSLKPLYQQYRAQKCAIAVMLSGAENLQALTSGLLCHNRLRQAKEQSRGSIAR